MIITKTVPFTKEEVEKLQEEFGTYIKTVIDIEKSICSAGMNRHFEGEQILLDQGSSNKNIWGGGIDLESGAIDFNSFINIRSKDGNSSNEILNKYIRDTYKKLTKHFFKLML